MEWVWFGMCALIAFAGMEPWARFAHKVLWHGPLYDLHESHHRPTGWLEKNDLFAVAHALPAIVLIVAGCEGQGTWAWASLGLGVGMTAFGFAYAIVHDGYIHGRLPVGFLGRSRWMRRIKSAHRAHHVRGEEPYGLFLGPQELRAKSREHADRRRRVREEAASR